MTEPTTPSTPSATPPTVCRRAVLAGAGVAAAGTVAVLAGCGSSTSAPKQEAAPGTVLGPSSDVPVGGGKIYADARVVVTQPTAGRFTALSATCTHAGCEVTSVEDGTIHCPCHGSRFALDGAVVNGPAKEPLPAKQVTVANGSITLA